MTFAVVALGLRCQPLLAAAQQPWFWKKAVYTGLLTVVGVISVRRVSVPGSKIGAAPLAAVVIVLAMLALGADQIPGHPPVRLTLWLGHTCELFHVPGRVCSPLILCSLCRSTPS